MSGLDNGKKGAPEKGKGSMLALVLFWAGVGIYAGLIVGWLVFPKLLYSEQMQPVDFNHLLHLKEVTGIYDEAELLEVLAESDYDCTACHYYREDGTYQGVPPLDKCYDCHTTDGPLSYMPEEGDEDYDFKMSQYLAEKTFVEEYLAKDKQVPWLVYSRQPDCVFFSHIPHTSEDVGGMRCKTCHGSIGTSKTMPVYKENRLTGYSIDIWGRDIAGRKENTWDSMKMDDCANCHKEAKPLLQEMREPCFICHK
ncbi:MAG: menaquinone reductase multiheme cytochrome c subunit QrcA [Desulfatibacillaceae bacterium]